MIFLTTSYQYLIYGFIGVLILIFILIIGVIIYGYLQYKQFIYRAKWSKIINRIIFDAIVLGNSKATRKIFNKGVFKNLEFRNFFLQKLVASEKKFSGDAESEIIKLFEDYKLEKEALQKLNQKKQYLIVVGIQELTAMHDVKAIPRIKEFLNHPSKYVMQEAQYSMVAFNGFEGLSFLHDTERIISEWQQLRLLLSINKVPENCEEDILAWLKSSNESVIVLTTRILRKFQMFGFYDAVLDLFQSESEYLKIQAVQTLHVLENFNTQLDYINVFDAQPLNVQLEILKIMKISNDDRCSEFLKEKLITSESTLVLLKVAETLAVLNEDEYLVKTLENYPETEPIHIIIKQALHEKGW